MQNLQTTIGIETMHNASGLGVNQLKQDFVHPNGFVSTSNSSSCNFKPPQVGTIDKVSSVVSMLKGILERKKLGNHVEKEAIEDSSLGYHGAQEVFAYSNSNQVHEIYIHKAQAGTFQDLTTADTVQGSIYADLESYVAPTNLIQMNIASREPSQSESSAAALVILYTRLRSSKLGASPHGCFTGSTPPVGSSPKPFPPFQHPSHQLLEENGFRQQKYVKYHKRYLSDRKKCGIGCSEDHEWRQAITAVGSGCIVALSVERYIVSNNLLIEFHQVVDSQVWC